MKKTFLFLCLAFGFVHCTESPAPTGPVTLRGYYVSGDGVRVFRNCADNKHYRVTDATGKLDSLYLETCFPAPIPYEATYAVLTGTIAPKESVGGVSEADGTFTVNRVDTLQSKTMFNACMPYEFWCHGTEPFWGLQISEAEGGIFLKNMADETGSRYAWTKPRTDGNAFVGVRNGRRRAFFESCRQKNKMQRRNVGHRIRLFRRSDDWRRNAARLCDPRRRTDSAAEVLNFRRGVEVLVKCSVKNWFSVCWFYFSGIAR